MASATWQSCKARTAHQHRIACQSAGSERGDTTRAHNSRRDGLESLRDQHTPHAHVCTYRVGQLHVGPVATAPSVATGVWHVALPRRTCGRELQPTTRATGRRGMTPIWPAPHWQRPLVLPSHRHAIVKQRHSWVAQWRWPSAVGRRCCAGQIASRQPRNEVPTKHTTPHIRHVCGAPKLAARPRHSHHVMERQKLCHCQELICGQHDPSARVSGSVG